MSDTEGLAVLSTSNMTPETFHTPKFSSLEDTSTPILLEGGSKRLMHKALLCASSTNFNAALNGSFAEATSNSLDLLDISDKVWDLYNDWAYQGQLYIGHLPIDTTARTKRDLLLLHSYVFADRYCIPLLKRIVITNFEDLLHDRERRVTWDFAIEATRKLPDADPLCRLLVDKCSIHVGEDRHIVMPLLEHTKRLPRWFLAEVMLRMSISLWDADVDRTPGDWQICDYHAHKTEEDRTTCLAKSVFVSKKRKRSPSIG